MADIVLSCPLRNEKREVKICLLIEHKSHPDKYTTIQVGGYIFSAFQKQIQNGEPLTPVIPVLLYHGKEKWKYRIPSGNPIFSVLFDKLIFPG